MKLLRNIKRRVRIMRAEWPGRVREWAVDTRIAAAKLLRMALPRKWAADTDGYFRLHLGCGPVHKPGMVHIDGLPAAHIDVVSRVDRLPFVDDGTCSLVYASHTLEHFSVGDVPGILVEWCRVLRPGGILRLSVPDFDKLLAIYEAEGKRLDWILGPLMGGQDYRYNFHRCHFTQSLLEYLLLSSGFRHVRAWTPGSDEWTTFDDWSGRSLVVEGRSYPVSLNLEAEK